MNEVRQRFVAFMANCSLWWPTRPSARLSDGKIVLADSFIRVAEAGELMAGSAIGSTWATPPPLGYWRSRVRRYESLDGVSTVIVLVSARIAVRLALVDAAVESSDDRSRELKVALNETATAAEPGGNIHQLDVD